MQLIMVLILMLIPGLAAADTCVPQAPTCIEGGPQTIGGLVFGDACEVWNAIADCEPDAPVDTCVPFRNVSEPFAATRPPLDGMCYETGRTCVLYLDGTCLRHEVEYRCWNGPPAVADAILVDRTYENFEETLVSNCDPLDSNPDCTFDEHVNIEGAEIRNINTLELNRAWWLRDARYTCINPAYDNTCDPFDDNPSCTATGETNCLAYRDDGTCAYREDVFDCDKDPSFSASCAPINTCIGEECYEIAQEASADFPTASVWLNFLDRAAKDNDCEADPGLHPGEDPDLSHCTSQWAQTCTPEHSDWNIANNVPGPLVCSEALFPHGAPEVFSGRGTNCRYNSVFNCCNASGFDSCKAREFDLRTYIKAGAAYRVGTRCFAENILGWCIESRRHYCVYNSKFARVFQEQANLQTGDRFYMGPGSSPTIECPGLTIAQMETLDVAAMDFSEVFGDMLDQADVPTEELLVQAMKEQMGLIAPDVQAQYE